MFPLLVLASIVLSGCNTVPSSGPTHRQIEQSVAEPAQPGSEVIQIVNVTAPVARELLNNRTQQLFSEAFPPAAYDTNRVAAGDLIEISVWEAPPATLFGSGSSSGTANAATALPSSRGNLFPEQTISADGNFSVPFAGVIQAAGRTTAQIEADIVARLKGKANQPQAMVRVLRNSSSTVTVVGEVNSSMRMGLSPRHEKLLDALAAAGGVRSPVTKTSLQLTRGSLVRSLPLDTIIRDPRQNIALYPGDVITALFQPLSFTALGATGKNEEINFEAQGISLAQALGRVGGLNDSRADAQGVFIFRYEDPKALTWPSPPQALTTDGKVPVIYSIDLKDPSSFFVMQTFGIQNRDMLYVANAPIAEIQKFANVVYSIAFPVINLAR